MSETFTFSGTVRRLGLDEFVTSAGGKTLAPAGTIVLESEGGALVGFTNFDGFIATFGRDPFAEAENPYLTDEAKEEIAALSKPEPEPEPTAPPARKRTTAKAKK